jgi:hypothetical protein
VLNSIENKKLILFYSVITESDLPYVDNFFDTFVEFRTLTKKFNFEYIIALNGVSQKLSNEIRSLCDSKKICATFIFFEKQLYLKKVINFIVNEYNFDFYCRLDPDDLIIPNNFLNFFKFFILNHIYSDLFYPNLIIINKVGLEVDKEVWNASLNNNFFISQPPHGAYSFIKRCLIVQDGGLNEEISRQDGFEIWLRVLTNGSKALHFDGYAFKYRQGKPSLSSNVSSLIDDRHAILKKTLKQEDTLLIVTLLPDYKKQSWFSKFIVELEKLSFNLYINSKIVIACPLDEPFDGNFPYISVRADNDLLQTLRSVSKSHQKYNSLVWVNPRLLSETNFDLYDIAGRITKIFDVVVVPTILCRQTVFEQIEGHGIRAVNASLPMQPRAFRKDCYIASGSFIGISKNHLDKALCWNDLMKGPLWSLEIDYLGDIF